MQVTREFLYNTISNSVPSAVRSVKAHGLCSMKQLEREVMTRNAAQNKQEPLGKEKLKPNYETNFSDVVTQCYIRGYN